MFLSSQNNHLIIKNRPTSSSWLWVMWATFQVAHIAHSQLVIAFLLLALHPFAKAVGLTNELQDVGVVSKPLQKRSRQLRLLLSRGAIWDATGSPYVSVTADADGQAVA